jgi:hypothetical protein
MMLGQHFFSFFKLKCFIVIISFNNWRAQFFYPAAFNNQCLPGPTWHAWCINSVANTYLCVAVPREGSGVVLLLGIEHVARCTLNVLQQEISNFDAIEKLFRCPFLKPGVLLLHLFSFQDDVIQLCSG